MEGTLSYNTGVNYNPSTILFILTYLHEGEMITSDFLDLQAARRPPRTKALHFPQFSH